MRLTRVTIVAALAAGLLGAATAGARDYRKEFDGYTRPTKLTLQFGPYVQDVRHDAIRVFWGTFGEGKSEVLYGAAAGGKLDRTAMARTQDIAAAKDFWT